MTDEMNTNDTNRSDETADETADDIALPDDDFGELDDVSDAELVDDDSDDEDEETEKPLERIYFEVTSELVDVTPNLAREWLAKNTHNRIPNEDVITRLSGAIQRGEWQLNSDAIAFDWHGILLNGQHRLTAIVRTKTTLPCLVIRGLEPKSQDTMDQGRPRSVADALRLRGEMNAFNLTATMNKIHIWNIGEAALRKPTVYRLTVAQAVAMLERIPEIRDFVRVGSRIHGRISGGLPVSLVAACAYRFDEIDHDDALDFWEKVAAGEMLEKTHPCAALRRMFFKNMARRQKLPQLVLHALTIKAWNAYRRGDDTVMLSWRAGGVSGEKFPEPI